MTTGSCSRCGSAWSFVNGQWLWKERSGAAYFLKEFRPLDEDGQPPPPRVCPCCRAKLAPAGKARVEEVQSGGRRAD